MRISMHKNAVPLTAPLFPLYTCCCANPAEKKQTRTCFEITGSFELV